MLREKREHLRCHFDAKVALSGGFTGEARAKDLSVGGMFLELAEDAPHPPIGAEVTLHFLLPGLGEVDLPGYIRWTRDGGIGVQFGLLGPRVTHAIGRLTLQSA